MIAVRRYLWLLAVTSVAAASAAWVRLGPFPEGLLRAADVRSTVVTDRHGVPLYEAPDADGTRGDHLSPDRLPPVIVDATLAAEDHRFFSHWGIDARAVARAATANAGALRVVQGGSTITQQVAKLLLARESRQPSRGIRTKLRETVLALRIEHRLTKQEILALYLSLAPYGNQVVGIERASRTYFGRPAEQLTPAQAAFLAGLPQRPSGFNPYRARDLSIGRQRRVLERMRKLGMVSDQIAAEARAEQLTFVRDRAPFLAPHFVEMVLAAAGGDRQARLTTTLDAALQREVEGIVRSHRAALDAHGARSAAVVVMDNLTGGWRAWEGSGGYFDGEHGGAINGAVSPRQPGSALKPFTYALAFEQGYTPASVLPDIRAQFATAEPGVVYSPRNYDDRFRGPLLARRALAGSINVPAVVLASELGVPSIVRLLRRAGLSTLDRTASHYGLGITLGNAEVRLDELVAAYAAFARRGIWLAPTAFEHEAAARRDVDLRAAAARAVMSPLAAYWVTDVLSDPGAREFIFGRGGSLDFPFPAAVKTGTSQGYRDNWTVGYTRDVTVGVWVGNFDRTPLRRSSGVTGAAPIFHDVMIAAERRIGGRPTGAAAPPIVERPDTLARESVCAVSGLRAGPACLSRITEWLPRATDEGPCSWHHDSEDGPLLFFPAEYREWAGAGAQPALARPAVAPEPSGPLPAPVRATFTIVTPTEGAVYLIDPTLRPEYQTLALRAASASGDAAVRWSVNGRPLGSATADRPVMWPLAAGRHRFEARDSRGNTASTSVTVK